MPLKCGENKKLSSTNFAFIVCNVKAQNQRRSC